MDGTLYLGDEVFPGAREFVRFLDETEGIDFMYLTNNASRSPKDYVNRLTSFGFPCDEESVFTSGMATVMYLKEHYPGKLVFVMGTDAFLQEMQEGGIRLSDGESADVVVAGFDLGLTYAKLETSVRLLRQGLPFIATNPDLVCPSSGGDMLPDCGSICALLTAASGRDPVFMGKPDRQIVDMISENKGIPNERICCVGDRLYTDIAVAKNAGSLSALVLSGETTPEMLEKSEIRPDYVFRDVSELHAALKTGLAEFRRSGGERK